MPEKHIGMRFRVGDLFPSDAPISRWLTGCCMALNDVLLVNNHLMPRLQEGGEPGGNVYFARLGAAHLYEAGKFLSRSERAPAIGAFIAALDDGARGDYERVRACARAESAFAAQLKHARDHFFHYAELLPEAPEHENLKRALDDQADTFDEILDPGEFREFRATFASNISIVAAFPDQSVLADFYTELREATLALMRFVPAAIAKHVASQPTDSWDYI